MRKTFLSFMALCAMIACGGDTLNSPTPTSTPEAQQAAAPVAAAPEAVSTPGTYDVKWLPDASWALTNTTSEMLYYTAQYTNFENQSKVLGSKDLQAAPDTTSEGSFGKSCVQVDLLAVGSSKIFAFAYFDAAGKPASAANATGSCKAPEPKPTPKPTPSPSPTCEYTIDCGRQDGPLSHSTHNNYCVNHSERDECEAGGGIYYSQQRQGSKCVTPLPGISNKRWQLNPGHSDEECLSKH